jgi:hypothetical protein
VTSSSVRRKRSLAIQMPTEVIKTKSTQLKPRIYGVTIHQEGNGAYAISVRHAGPFRLKDYDVLEFEVSSARLVRRE